MINNKPTLVINIFGGPGAGKSTGAAYIFSYLKMRGVNVELVTEVAKDLTWEEASNNLKDQIYVFGKQQHRLYRCSDKVDVIITDSPIFLSTLYNKDQSIDSSLRQLALDVINKYDNYNVLLQRVKPYNPVGRSQTAEESDEIKEAIEAALIETEQEYELVNGDISGYNYITKKVIEILINRGVTLPEIYDSKFELETIQTRDLDAIAQRDQMSLLHEVQQSIYQATGIKPATLKQFLKEEILDEAESSASKMFEVHT